MKGNRMSYDDGAPRRYQRLDPPAAPEARRPSDPDLAAFLKEFVGRCPSAPGWGANRIKAHLEVSTGRDVGVAFVQWAMNELGR
jgi:hypothetical protein